MPRWLNSPKFQEGARAKGTAPAVIDHLWSLMERAGDYSFNKSHAACYALISYRTAYFKANHPVQYMAALISSVMDTKDKVPLLRERGRRHGHRSVATRHQSVLDFRGVEGRIRFGLNAVKNVGETAIRAILESRDQVGPFTDLFDFCERVDLGVVNGRAIGEPTKSGPWIPIGPSRRGMLMVMPQAMAHGKRSGRRRLRPSLDLRSIARTGDGPSDRGGGTGSGWRPPRDERRKNGHPPWRYSR